MNKKLKLQEKYKGLIITKNVYLVGNVTIDTDKLDENKYNVYKDFGFDIFEEVEETFTAEFTEEQVEQIKDDFFKSEEAHISLYKGIDKSKPVEEPTVKPKTNKKQK